MVHCKTELTAAVATDQILVGTLDRFTDGKAAEERDRVKHCSMDSWK